MLPYSQISAIYVSPTGAASASGTSPIPTADGQGPLASVADALTRIAELRRIGIRQPISVRLEAGVYEHSAPVVIGEDVSSVTVEPQDGEVILSGGRRITGWRTDTYGGVPCLSAEVPAGMHFTDFYVNGKRAKMTRYPAVGLLYPEDVENHGRGLMDGSHWFIAAEGDIRDFRNFEDCIISFNHYWIDEHSPIASYDPMTRKVTMVYRSRFSVAGGKESHSGLAYYIENVAEMFAHPGEWYHDRGTGRVYYIPEDGITAENIEAYAPVTDCLFVIEGKNSRVSDIRLRNLTLAYTRGDYASRGATSADGDSEPCASDAQSLCNAPGVIRFRRAENCSVEGCTLTCIGHHGILLAEGTEDIRITDTAVTHGGMGGIRMSGTPCGGDPSDECHHNTVTRCRLMSLGERYSAACGVLIMHAHHCEVSHCEIGDLFYTGVSVGWVWGYAPSAAHHNRVLCNHIHGLGKGILSDMGGVYLLGNQPGTVVAGNLIHDVKSAHYGGWALYTDEGSTGITLENNICYNVSQNCYHQHYGSMNTVRNNIFAHAGTEVMRISRAESHLSIIFENNIVVADGKPVYAIRARHIAEGTAASHRNHYCCTGGRHVAGADAELTLAEAQERGFDTDCEVIPDPFADAAHNDFRLIRDVEGFAPISLPRTGPYSDRE